MGGPGSGNWYRFDTKSTVEESLTLAMREFRGRLHPHAAGTLTWTWTSGSKSSVGFFVTWGDVPTITLLYRWRDSEDVRIPIRLQNTPTQFGGRRRWFTCPLIVNGVVCNRRVGKLYLPPGARYFGCRTCHRLTYRSCQEAHQMERFFARHGMQYDPDICRILFRRDRVQSRNRDGATGWPAGTPSNLDRRGILLAFRSARSRSARERKASDGPDPHI